MSMDVYTLQLRNAATRARQLVHEFGLEAPEHIRLEDLAFALGVEVVTGGIVGSAARITLHNGRARIRIRPEDSEGRMRFSIAHELGHFILHRDRMTRLCNDTDFRSFRDSGSRRLETEANVFASELLIPSAMAVRTCDLESVTMEGVERLARTFRTSLTAAAVRFVELCTEPCALVSVQNGTISWSIPSSAFNARLATGPVDRDTLTYRIFAGDQRTTRGSVPAAAWLASARHDSVITEDVRYLRTYRQALVLLHARWLERRAGR